MTTIEGLLEAVFSVGSVLRPAVRLSVESQPVKRRRVGGVKWPPVWDPVSWVVSWQEFRKYGGVKGRLILWYLECVIQWDCYSSCVKSVARKRLVETVIGWGHYSVCASQLYSSEWRIQTPSVSHATKYVTILKCTLTCGSWKDTQMLVL
jgi:hypothetical protein